MSVKDIVWYHGEDYEKRANECGYTIGPMAKEFTKRYKRLHNSYIFGCMTYTQYQKGLKDLEKDLCRYAEEIRWEETI